MSRYPALSTDIAGRLIPDAAIAASSGANNVRFNVLSKNKVIVPAFVAAAFRILNVGSVLMIFPMELPTMGAFAIGVGSGTSLLQDVARIITSKTLMDFTSQFFI